VLRVGGIGGVGTEEEYRRRGLARQVLERCVELMTREGYDASFLFGIQDFYHRFGFATCMAEQELVIDTVAARRAEKRLRVRPMRRNDLPSLVRIYNRDNAERTASCVRPRSWGGFTRGTWWGVAAWPRLAVDRADRPVGYVTCDAVPERCKVAEVGGRGDDAHHTLLHLLSRRARSLGVEQIQISAPPDHAFALFCRGFGCRTHSLCPRNGGPMGRIIHLRPFLTRLAPVLASRWASEERELVLATDLGTCALVRDRGRSGVQVAARHARGALRVSLPQDALMQLACGYRSAAACWESGQLAGSAAARHLAAQLFPVHEGHMWWSDRF
ncbi:MAG: GNAT family N-acetyltransferase, partial [Gemmatimonadota bacterium]